MITVGVIGGTGLYAVDALAQAREVSIETPFGSTSDVFTAGDVGNAHLIFVPRHGRGHRLLPAEVPYRANLFALKSLGAEWVISISAVGSMREEIHPGDLVLPTQYIDRTQGRAATFFGDGIAAHVSVANPVCPTLNQHLAKSVRACGLRLHEGGTYLCIDGPAFSTRAESALYRQWGVDIIGMTAMPEAKLAREAELHYATLALVTDYDCWKASEEAVSADSVVAILRRNTANVLRVLSHAVPGLEASARSATCACPQALASAVLTDPSRIPAERRTTLGPILGRHLG